MGEKTLAKEVLEKTNNYLTYQEATQSMAAFRRSGDATPIQSIVSKWNINSVVTPPPVVDDMRGELDSLKLSHTEALERIDFLEKYAASIVQLTQRIEDLELELKIIK